MDLLLNIIDDVKSGCFYKKIKEVSIYIALRFKLTNIVLELPRKIGYLN